MAAPQPSRRRWGAGLWAQGESRSSDRGRNACRTLRHACLRPFLWLRFAEEEMSDEAVVYSVLTGLLLSFWINGASFPPFPAFLVQPPGELLLSNRSTKEPEQK